MVDQASKVILGTAGHVDHGKTALVRALTGVDTDRLPEEKARGISIELGFAEFRLPSGRSAAIIDVPGHERFIKNMLAGATGIDLVLLVVAADEGVMPQTREHLDIVGLLGIRKGIKVITKADTVDEDWLELVKDDVESLVRGTFLEDAPLVVTSAVTGTGLDVLKQTVDRMIDEIPPRDSLLFPRLPIDRAFSIAGYGTVVTGTLVSGQLHVEDKVEILPSGRTARVRSLQVHGKPVASAFAGQRVAVNLAGVDREEVRRGDVITLPGWLKPCRQFAARIRILERTASSLENLSLVHLHYGTAETIARVVLLEADEIAPGEDGLARLRTDDQVVLTRGDRFIMRSYSPVTTIGGGVVISAPSSHKRKSPAAIADLKLRERQDPEQDIISLTSKPPYVLSLGEIANRLGLAKHAAESIVQALVSKHLLTSLGPGFISESVLTALIARVAHLVSDFLRKRPLRLSLSKEEARRMAAPEMDARAFTLVLTEAQRRGQLAIEGDRVRPAEDVRVLPERLVEARRLVLTRLGENPFSPPPVGELTKGIDLTSEEQADLIANICESGNAVKVSDTIIFDAQAVEEARRLLVERLEQAGSITVSDFRDVLGTSRKFALPLLEYFDQIKLTKRKGDERVPFFSKQ